MTVAFVTSHLFRFVQFFRVVQSAWMIGPSTSGTAAGIPLASEFTAEGLFVPVISRDRLPIIWIVLFAGPDKILNRRSLSLMPWGRK